MLVEDAGGLRRIPEIGPVRESGADGSSRRNSRKAPLGAVPCVLVVCVLLAITLIGLPYYISPVPIRLRNPMHPALKPSGYVGQTAGILAFAMFLFLWLYPFRKKFRWLAFTGKISTWLDIHIFAGLAIPLMAAVHASWRFTGMIGLGYAAMLVVCLSGIIGKYIYVKIPRTKSGVELTKDEIAQRRARLLEKLASYLHLEPELVEEHLGGVPVPEPGTNPIRTFIGMLRSDYDRWKRARSLKRQLSAGGSSGREGRAVVVNVVKLARREIALTQQMRMLDATHRVFRFWHVAHRPIAVTALVAVLLHVGAMVALGVTWIW